MSSSLPHSYADLPLRDIKLSHHPPSSPTPTPVVVVTLHRPGKHNAFTKTMMEELERVLGLLDADDRVRCIVVTGHGSVFCAGADLDIGFVGGQERVNDHRDGYIVPFFSPFDFCLRVRVQNPPLFNRNCIPA